jgi:hypothetical protein
MEMHRTTTAWHIETVAGTVLKVKLFSAYIM